MSATCDLADDIHEAAEPREKFVALPAGDDHEAGVFLECAFAWGSGLVILVLGSKQP